MDITIHGECQGLRLRPGVARACTQCDLGTLHTISTPSCFQPRVEETDLVSREQQERVWVSVS